MQAAQDSVGPTRSTDVSSLDRISALPTSLGVVTLMSAFRDTGGILRAEELARILADLKMGDVASLGRAMASREICSFQWRSEFWIPMFQFNLGNLSFNAGTRKILGELTGVFDGWMLAVWFAQPNSWLKGEKPIDLLATDLPAVFEAARADRYVVEG